MTKKLLALLLVLAMVFTMTACGSDKPATESGADTSTVTDESKEEVENVVVVGDITSIDANMMGGWTNGAANAKIRTLVFGSSVVAYTKEGQFMVDETIVADSVITVNEDGTKTYQFTLNEGLKYSDGSPITAKDYLFDIMLSASPEFVELGGSDLSNGRYFIGYEDYNTGVSSTFEGLKLIDELTFSLTIKAEELPYYYDIAYAVATPLPMAIIAPDATITDDGTGATLSEAFNIDVLKETVNNPETGFRFKPTTSSGPYVLSNYDVGTKEAVLTINPNYAGTYDGVQPSIEKIVMKLVEEATMMDELRAGSVDLLTSTSGGDSIETGLDIVDEGLASYSSYLRAGYGKIAFSCDFGPTQFPEVRQAMAYALDRDEFARQYSGGYAQVVHGYYGLSQQETKDSVDFIENELNHYPVDLAVAEQTLVDGGWTLNADGSDYVKGTDTLRHKDVDGEMMPLIIQWANTDNIISDLISTMLPEALAGIGMKLESTIIEFTVMLQHLYREGDIMANPEYHMFNLATGFTPINSYWLYFSPEEFGNYNTAFLDDAELQEISTKMKSITPGDYDSWLELWQQLQARWNELMVEIPLYSDEYHDFYNSNLTNYTPDALWQWESAIVYASMG